MRKIAILLLVLCAAAVVSMAGELMPSKADHVFLVITGFSFVTIFTGSLLYSKFDKTNGNDSGTIAFSLIVLIDLIIIVVTPVLVLLGAPFLPMVIGALAVILVTTGYLTYDLIR